MFIQQFESMGFISGHHTAIAHNIGKHDGGYFYLRFCHWHNLMYFIAFAEDK
jgi:hypothetical protein